jgi:hypothetical protein
VAGVSYVCDRCGYERAPEDDAALALLEALAEEFAGEAIVEVGAFRLYGAFAVVSPTLLREDGYVVEVRLSQDFVLCATDEDVARLAIEDLREEWAKAPPVENLAFHA